MESEEIETVEVVARKLAPWWAVVALGLIGISLFVAIKKRG